MFVVAGNYVFNEDTGNLILSERIVRDSVHLTAEEAEAFYWDRIGSLLLPPGYKIFWFAVNLDLSVIQRPPLGDSAISFVERVLELTHGYVFTLPDRGVVNYNGHHVHLSRCTNRFVRTNTDKPARFIITETLGTLYEIIVSQREWKLGAIRTGGRITKVWLMDAGTEDHFACDWMLFRNSDWYDTPNYQFVAYPHEQNVSLPMIPGEDYFN